MKKDVPMTTCRCEKNDTDLVMSREFLMAMLDAKAKASRTQVLDEIINMLKVQSSIYFSQSLIGGATYFTHKTRTIDNIIKEIEGIKHGTNR